MDDRLVGFGQLLRAAREALGASLQQLAVLSGLIAGAVDEAEAGSGPPDWRLVDSIASELELSGQALRARQLIAARSRLEAPLHGIPGTYCACPGELANELHWVRRARGQIYCAEHGLFLIPACYGCGFLYSELTSPAYRCPGCNMPIEAMIESLHVDYAGEIEADEREALAALRTTCSAQTNVAPTVRRGAPLSIHDKIGAHNRTREIAVQGLKGRALEHYAAARHLSEKLGGKAFSRSELLEALEALSPDRPATSVLPSDFCLHSNEQSVDNPWFLYREQRGRYRFFGIDGHGDQGVSVPTLKPVRT